MDCLLLPGICVRRWLFFHIFLLLVIILCEISVEKRQNEKPANGNKMLSLWLNTVSIPDAVVIWFALSSHCYSYCTLLFGFCRRLRIEGVVITRNDIEYIQMTLRNNNSNKITTNYPPDSRELCRMWRIERLLKTLGIITPYYYYCHLLHIFSK